MNFGVNSTMNCLTKTPLACLPQLVLGEKSHPLIAYSWGSAVASTYKLPPITSCGSFLLNCFTAPSPCPRDQKRAKNL